MELHIIAAWVALGFSIVIPLLLSYFIEKRKRRRLQPLLGVVQPKKKVRK
jgi:hypothetical protein